VRAGRVHAATLCVQYAERRERADRGTGHGQSSGRPAGGRHRGTAVPRLEAHGIFGLILILGIGVAFSRNRRAISRRVVAWGVGLQLLFAIFVLRVPVGQKIFSCSARP